MHHSLVFHDRLPDHVHPHVPSVAAKGFRPFFLLASAFAIAIVPLWLLVLHGALQAGSYIDPVSWHAHEMIFGFTVAVIAGFLLTAAGNWTQRETAVGAPLMGLAALWLAGRLAMIFPTMLPRGVPAMIDAAFLPALMFAIGRPLVAAKSRRNFVMLAVLGALFLTNLVVHFDGLGIVGAGLARRACSIAVDLVLLLILILTGRIVPMFTRNATRIAAIRSLRVLDAAAVGGMAVLTIVDTFAPSTRAGAVLSGAVGLLAAGRSTYWGARHSLRIPLLWILHAGNAWLILGLVLRAIAGMNGFAFGSLASLAMHALTVGAIGSLTLGMMARVSLGHTGRPLVASSAMACAFAAINVAALIRVVGPMLAPQWYLATLDAAGLLWVAAFAVFLIVYTPILLQPRRDGKPG